VKRFATEGHSQERLVKRTNHTRKRNKLPAFLHTLGRGGEKGLNQTRVQNRCRILPTGVAQKGFFPCGMTKKELERQRQWRRRREKKKKGGGIRTRSSGENPAVARLTMISSGRKKEIPNFSAFAGKKRRKGRSQG